MRYLLMFICSFVVSQTALAGANFTVQNVIYKDLIPRPMVGVSIDQHIADKLFATGWVGIGSRPDQDATKNWSSMKVGADYRLERISFGGGMLVNAVSDDWERFYPQIADAEKEYAAYLKMSVKLW